MSKKSKKPKLDIDDRFYLNRIFKEELRAAKYCIDSYGNSNKTYQKRLVEEAEGKIKAINKAIEILF